MGAAGCEAFNDNVQPSDVLTTSAPVTYAYNMNHPGVEEVSLVDMSRLKAQNLASLMTIIETVKSEAGRRPARVDELYILDDELDPFAEALAQLRHSYAETPLQPVYEQQIGLHVLDQFMPVPEGHVYTQKRKAIIGMLTRELLRWESQDARVLANALLMLETHWADEELLDGIAYVETIAPSFLSGSKAAGRVHTGLPEDIQDAQRLQHEQTEIILAALDLLKSRLSDDGE